MEETLNLQLDWKDSSSLTTQCPLTVEVAGLSETLQSQGSAKFPLPEANERLQVKLTLKSKPVYSTTQSFRAIFGLKLAGRVDKWLHLRADDGSSQKIRIVFSIAAPKTVKPKVPKKAQKPRFQCPYLESLISGAEPSLRREEVGNTLRISLEPESSAKNEAGEQFAIPPIEDLSIPYLQSLHGSELKSIIKSLCEDTNHLQVFAQQLPAMREVLTEKITRRRELEKQSEAATLELRTKCCENDSSMQALLAHRLQLDEQSGSDAPQIRKLEQEKERLQGQLIDLRRRGLLIQTENFLKGTEDSELDKCRGQLSDLATRKKQTQEFIKQQNQEFKQLLEDLSNERVTADLESTSRDGQTLKESLQQVRSANKAKQKQLVTLQTEQKFDENPSIAEYDLNCQSHRENLHKLSGFSKNLGADLNAGLERLLEQRRDETARISVLEDEENHVRQVNNEIQRQLLDLGNKQVTRSQLNSNRQSLVDLEQRMAALRSLRTQIRASILQDLKVGGAGLVEEGDRMYNKTKQFDTMIDQADNADNDLEELKETMGQLKKRNPPYVPVKGDAVDQALAAELNGRKSQLPASFLREGPGKYEFGGKKVAIKSENGRLLFRSGNSCTGLEEFLESYRNKGSNLISLFGSGSSNKMAIGNALLGLSKKK